MIITENTFDDYELADKVAPTEADMASRITGDAVPTAKRGTPSANSYVKSLNDALINAVDE